MAGKRVLQLFSFYHLQWNLCNYLLAIIYNCAFTFNMLHYVLVMILSKREKLLERLLSHPANFSFAELTTLLGHFGYYSASGSKTGGSRVSFTDWKGDYIRIHKPHPRDILKPYQVEDIIDSLTERGLL